MAFQKSTATGESDTVTQSRAELKGENIGFSINHSESVSDGVSDSRSDTVSSQQTTSANQSWQEGSGATIPFQSGTPATINQNQGLAAGKATSDSESSSQSHNHGSNHSEATSDGVGLQNSHQTSVTQTKGRSHANSLTSTSGTSHTRQRSFGEQESEAIGTSRAKSSNQGESDSVSHQDSESAGTSHQRSRTASVSVGVRHQMHELFEKTPGFYNLQEIRYRQTCRLMDLPNATAVVRVENGPPHLTKIAHVALHPVDNEFAAFHTQLFRSDVINAHPDYYLTSDAAITAIEARQMAVFQTTFRLGFRSPAAANPPAADAAVPPAIPGTVIAKSIEDQPPPDHSTDSLDKESPFYDPENPQNP